MRLEIYESAEFKNGFLIALEEGSGNRRMLISDPTLELRVGKGEPVLFTSFDDFLRVIHGDLRKVIKDG